MKLSRWYLVKDSSNSAPFRLNDQGYSIRRYAREAGKTKWFRLPIDEYDREATNEHELRAFVKRLNKSLDTELSRAKEAYDIQHEFLSQKILDEYAEYVHSKSTDASAADVIIKRTFKSFLAFFVNRMQLNDPVDWFSQQSVWGAALLNQKPKTMTDAKWEKIRLLPAGERQAAKTIRDTVMFANRFYKWLHTRHPKLFPLLIFEPLSRAQLRLHDGKRQLDKRSETLGQFIPEKDWKVIEKSLPADIYPFVWLAYNFGLRRAETLAIRPEDIKKGYLHPDRQLVAIPSPDSPNFGPLKSRLSRKVSYWFTTPDEAYDVVSRIEKRMHTATLSRRVAAAMLKLGFSYQMHDCRRTWITRALRSGKSLAEVRDCAGHSSIETTNRYLMRDEEFDSDVFTPNKKTSKTS